MTEILGTVTDLILSIGLILTVKGIRDLQKQVNILHQERGYEQPREQHGL